MFTKLLFNTCLILLFSTIHADPLDFIVKCKNADVVCMTKAGQAAWPAVAEGIPSIGIETSDPLHVKLVENKQSALQLKFSDLVVDGLKKCVVKNVLLDIKKNVFDLTVDCKLNVKGQYVLAGKLSVFPIEGSGAFSILINKLNIKLFGELGQKPNKSGKTVLYVPKFNHQTTPVEPIVFQFDNLFGGNKQLSDAIHDFANTNYKDVLNEVGQPVLDEIYKQVMKTAVKALKSLPIDEYFLN